MARIQLLPESVARRIAAGEVIERPVSVVKELVENSLDAGARRITVELEQGGRTRIAVVDDGEGIAPQEVALAFEAHATSKLRHEEDLLRITTLGFRGEALPSIAAVAGVELRTRRREDATGTCIRVRGGETIATEPAAVPVGTRVEVRDLFFNTPARRKFLKTPAAEAGQVSQLLGRLALAHEAVGFTLVQDGREALVLPPSDLRSRIRKVLGRETEAELRPVASDGAIAVTGFASHSHFSLPHSRLQLFFVNGRLVRDRMLLHALLSAYATHLPRGRHPAAVLFVRLPAEDVDVNVHPTKLEVRFRSSQSVHEAIARALRGEIVSASASIAATAGAVAETVPSYSPALPSFPPERAQSRLRLVPVRSESLFRAPETFTDLRIVGQLFAGYLVCEDGADLVLVDQHAAHERIVFERLREARRGGRVEAQAFLVPEAIELAAGEAEALAAHAEELAALGLELEAFGERAVVVRAAPSLLRPGDVAALVRALAGEVEDPVGRGSLEVRTDALLATIACHSVVRVGQRLSDAEMTALLAQMDETHLNGNCPHGRPVAIRLQRGEIERRFGR